MQTREYPCHVWNEFQEISWRRNSVSLQTDGNSMYNSLSLVWLRRSFMVLHLTCRWIKYALFFCKINLFNLEIKTSVLNNVCRLIVRAERLGTMTWQEHSRINGLYSVIWIRNKKYCLEQKTLTLSPQV